MKKYIKVICVLLVMLILFAISSIAYAANNCGTCGGTGYLYGTSGSSGVKCTTCGGQGTVPEHTMGEIVKEADGFIEEGEGQNSIIKEENMQSLSNTLYNILLVIGIILAFIIGGVLAIQFLVGGVEGQVDVKKALIPYIIGCVILFGAFTIWKIILGVLQ